MTLESGVHWLPHAASDLAAHYDALFAAVTGVTGLVAVGVFVTIAAFGLRYRRGSTASRAHDKPDPRFEAARQKAEREAEVYAERNEHAGASEEADEQPTPEPVDADATKGSFSFNMTGEAEEGE